jgi:hypothetical protein
MLLTAKHLPSQGKFIFNQPGLNVLPLTFKQIVNYMSNPEANDVLAYRKDLKLLEENGINLEFVSLLDADYLIYFMKSLTISDSLKYVTTVKCPHCGNSIQTEIDTANFNFLDYEDTKVPSRIVLGEKEYEIEIPTVAEFIKCLDNYVQNTVSVDIDHIKLLSVFKDYNKAPRVIENEVLNCRGESAGALLWLEGMLFDRVTPIKVSCPNCQEGSGGGEQVSINVNIDHINKTFFRDFMWNNPITEDKIHFKQIRQDG